jgi:hypothetical protein
LKAASARPHLRGKLILAGLLFYFLFLLIQLPVAWLITKLPADTPIRFGDAKGTLWNGTLEDIIWQVNYDRIRLGHLSWSWLPAEILSGRIGFKFELTQAGNPLTGVLLLGKNNHTLKNVQGRVDAALLGVASRPFGLLQPQGSLVLDIANLYQSANRIHGAARLDWQGARSGLVASSLGDYRAELKADPDGRRARIEVTTLQGPLAIIGNGQYQPGKDLQGSLRLTPPQDENGKVFHPVLNLLGRPDATGTWSLFFNPR